jgi:putative endonuclease
MYFVYVLKSSIDDRLYKGLTSDIKRRLNEHNKGKTKSTRPYKPWQLVHLEEFISRAEARD